MSAINSFIPISFINENNNINAFNSKCYIDLINYGAIRKQFSRIIPNYVNYKNQSIGLNKMNISSIEEYKKLTQEIISIEESILLLKQKKQKKLNQIEELRNLMRKEGQKKKIIYNKNQIKNNNYSREKKDKKSFGCNKRERKGSNGNFKSSDETEGGFSMAPPSNSGLSDNCDIDEGNQKDEKYCFYRNSSNNNDSSFIFFIDDEENNNGKAIQKEIHEEESMLHTDN